MKQFAFLAGTFFILTNLAFADGLKVATVDMGRLLNESKAAQTQRAELKKLTDAAKKKVEAKKTSIDGLKARLQDAKVSPDSKEAQTFRTQARDFNLLVKDTDEELKRKYMSITKVLSDKAMKAIESYASANGYNLVLDKSKASKGVVIYGSETYDITSQVLSALNSSK